MYSERASRVPGAAVWANEPTPGEQPAPVLPDGCSDLMFDGVSLLVAGPDTHSYEADASAPIGVYVGMRVPSGAGPPLWGVPGSEIADQRAPLAALWPEPLVRRLTERVALATDPGAELERIVADRWHATPPDPAMLSIAASLRAGEAITSIAARCGYSERQLHRRSLNAFGYGPKTLARILRLVSALDQARGGVRLATVAHLCGYADQAHLSRDVRALTGRTVTALLGRDY